MVPVLEEDATATDAELDALNRGSFERDRLEDAENLRWWADEGAQAEYERAVTIGLEEAIQRGDHALLARLIPAGVVDATSGKASASAQAKILSSAASRDSDDGLAVALAYLVATDNRMLLRVLLEALSLHDLVAAADNAKTSKQRKEADHRAKRLALNAQLHGMVRPAVRLLAGLTPIPPNVGPEVF